MHKLNVKGQFKQFFVATLFVSWQPYRMSLAVNGTKCRRIDRWQAVWLKIVNEV